VADLVPADLDANPWASCGPTALAAVLHLPLADVRAAFPNQRPGRTWTNLLHMRAAIETLGMRWTATPTDLEAVVPAGAHQVGTVRQWPRCGVVQVFFRGPWERPGVPAGAALQRSHWIGVSSTDGKLHTVFDVNTLDDNINHGWSSRSYWEKFTLARILEACRGANGLWWTRAGIEVVGP
jgi:hypothetical protein